MKPSSFPKHPRKTQHSQKTHKTQNPHKIPSRVDYLDPFHRPTPPVAFVLQHVTRREWVVFAIGLALVAFVSFWAIFLNFSHSDALNRIEEPSYKGVITLDTLPDRLTAFAADDIVARAPTSVKVDLTRAILQGALSEIEETGAPSAHISFICFSAGNTFYHKTGVELYSGDYVDLKITAPVASALLESAENDPALSADPDATFSIIVPVTKRPFIDAALGMRAFFQDLSWKTGHTITEIFSFIMVAAVTLAVLFLLWCRFVYREAKFDAAGDIIMMGDNYFPETFPENDDAD